MPFPKNDSNLADQRVPGNNSPKLLAVHCAVLCALLGMSISKSGTALISDTVQAEFVASNPGSPTPMLLAQPALQTARAN